MLSGTVRHVADAGPLFHVRVACGKAKELEWSVSLSRREYGRTGAAVGQDVYLAILPNDVHVMRQ